MRILVCCLLAAVAAACASSAPAQKRSAPKGPLEFEVIAELEDRRSFGLDDKLPLWALTHNDPQVRARALLALGRIQDPASIDTVIKGLTDPDVKARTEAAFAASLLGLSWQKLTDVQKAKLAEGLKPIEAEETEAPVKLALIDALARVGSLPAAERLIDRLGVAGDVQAHAALGLGITAKLMAPTPLPPRVFNLLAGLVKKEQPQNVRYGAAYALAAAKSPSARTWLLFCANDEAPEIRALCAKGLADAGTEIDAVTLKKLLDDPDYRVAIEAARSLAKLSAKCKGPCPALGALPDLSRRVERLVRGDTAAGGHPLLALAQQGLPPAGLAVLTALRAQMVGAIPGIADARIRKDVANVECRFAAAIDRINGSLKEVLTCGGPLIPEADRLAMGITELSLNPAADPARRAAELGAYLTHGNAKVKLAAVHALGENKSLAAKDGLRALLADQDPIVAVGAASALARIGDKESVPGIKALMEKAKNVPELAPPIAEAFEDLDAKDAVPDLQGWLTATHWTVRIAAAQALTKLTGQPVVAPRVEMPVEQVKPAPLPVNAALKVKTEKGDFEIKLWVEDAPLTALNLYTLAKRAFFTGTTFHRIVPDFVAQGGDPRGDGEGGPGYTIRCEVNHRPYVRGVVGMALGGKDTGGSQFFVMLAAHPHLDGKYTSFGEVTAGQEVVDALLEGDKILEIKTLPEEKKK